MRWEKVLNNSLLRRPRVVRQPPKKLLKQLSSWRQTVPVSFTAQNSPWMEGAPLSDGTWMARDVPRRSVSWLEAILLVGGLDLR